MTDTPNTSSVPASNSAAPVDPYASRTLNRTTDISAFRLDGRVAVVIGGTGVLCGNIAETLARAGATTVIVGRDQSKADAILERMRAEGSQGLFESCDTKLASLANS